MSLETESEKNLIFFSPSKGKMSLSQVVWDIVGFINEEPEETYSVVIGTDSQTRRVQGKTEIDFVTAVVVHRVGTGGRYFYIRDRQRGNPVLRQKIYTETLNSLSLAGLFVPMLRGVIPEKKYSLEIHIDVGSQGITRDMIREVVGMVTGNGYVAKTKPDSYCASVVADRHTG